MDKVYLSLDSSQLGEDDFDLDSMSNVLESFVFIVYAKNKEQQLQHS